jgi:hypothetical protein
VSDKGAVSDAIDEGFTKLKLAAEYQFFTFYFQLDVS